jgi:hypothetical protein
LATAFLRVVAAGFANALAFVVTFVFAAAAVFLISALASLAFAATVLALSSALALMSAAVAFASAVTAFALVAALALTSATSFLLLWRYRSLFWLRLFLLPMLFW